MTCNGCDGGHCTTTTGEIRKLPYGSDGGNMLLCCSCFLVETKQRREANIDQWRPEFENIPIWEALEVYAPKSRMIQERAAELGMPCVDLPLVEVKPEEMRGLPTVRPAKRGPGRWD